MITYKKLFIIIIGFKYLIFENIIIKIEININTFKNLIK